MENKWTKEKIIKEILEWIFCFLIAYLIYLFINYYFIAISGVKQVSMKPTANEGEKLLIQRTKVFKKELNHGDIITFIAPSNDINKKNIDYKNVVSGSDAMAKFDEHSGLDSFIFDFMCLGKKSYIKRLIGLPGDHIEVKEDGTVFRNDKMLDESYLKDGITSRNGAYINVIVPENYIFAMGDNRLESLDSRYFGCVPMSKIDGYVLNRIWPLNKIGKLK
ncbi:MAG: signal peptidase I [Clostridia bacterium]